jgi:hypothetical protein
MRSTARPHRVHAAPVTGVLPHLGQARAGVEKRTLATAGAGDAALAVAGAGGAGLALAGAGGAGLAVEVCPHDGQRARTSPAPISHAGSISARQ